MLYEPRTMTETVEDEHVVLTYEWAHCGTVEGAAGTGSILCVATSASNAVPVLTHPNLLKCG